MEEETFLVIALIRGSERSRLRWRWRHMVNRCHKKDDPSYCNYGARGIRVCKRWRDSFDNFLIDMGPMPTPQHTLERIDNDGDYTPRNCRWATKKEQLNNTRRNRNITAFGKAQTIMQWCEEKGLKYASLRSRLNRGMSPEEALSRRPQRPIGTYHHKAKLTEDNVRFIRKHCKGNGDCPIFARKFGVSLSTILCVVRRTSWKDLV